MTSPIDIVLGRLRSVQKTGNTWKACCPSHHDRTPSLSIGLGQNGRVLLNCFNGCRPESIVERLGLSMKDLFEPSEWAVEQSLVTKKSRPKIKTTDSKKQGQCFPSKEAAIEKFESLHGKASSMFTYHDARGDEACVIVRWDKKGKKDFRPVTRYADGWRIEAMPEPRLLYHLSEFESAQRVIVCEGEKAVDAVRSLGFVATTSSGGAKAASKTDWRPLAGKVVWIFPDNDDAGRKYASIVAEILSRLTPGANVKIIELSKHWPACPKGGDLADALAEDAVCPPWNDNSSPDAIRSIIETWADQVESATASYEIEIQPDGKRQRVSIRMHDKILMIDSLYLSRSKERDSFVKKVTEKNPFVSADELETRLLEHEGKIRQASQVTPVEVERDPLENMDPEIISSAEQMLQDPDLISKVADDLNEIGIAGETTLATILYLVGVSRLLRKPLSAIVQGTSSSGKSYTLEKVAELFPPEAIILAKQMTPQALVHMPEGSLSHRWIVAGERSRKENDETAEATRALREMISSGRLSKLMPVKTNDGIRTELIEQDGPIAYCETTTLGKIFDEDANRCLILQTDETPEQTRRILCKLAKQVSSQSSDYQSKILIHHAMQRMLPRAASVSIPFAQHIANPFPTERVEARRAFSQLLAVIQASALLYFKQRESNEGGEIVATKWDYRLAYELLHASFTQTIEKTPTKTAMAFFQELPLDNDFTVKAEARRQKKSEDSAKGWIRQLDEAGLVEIAEKSSGNQPAKWRRTGNRPEAKSLLPEPEEVFREV